jgi:hypothetical protein
VVTKNFPKYLQNTSLTKNVLRVWQKAAQLHTSYSTQVPSTRPSTLLDRTNFLRLTEPNPTNSMGHVKVSQQTDAEKCDYVIVVIIIIIIIIITTKNKNNNATTTNNNNGLTIETQRMWNVKTKVIQTGTISKSFRKYLSNIPGKHEIKKCTENNQIGHCARSWESTNVMVQNVYLEK